MTVTAAASSDLHNTTTNTTTANEPTTKAMDNNPMGDSAQEQSNNEPVEMDETMEKIEQGKRLLALRKYSEAADLFGQLAQDLTQKHDSDSLHPELAPVWFLYGQALFQLATSQAPLLGPSIAEDEKESAPADNDRFVFEGEPDTQENEGEAGDDDEDEEDEEEEQEGGDENENDFEAAWEALETARLIYSKMPESRMELANVYLALGDLSLEEEKFDQASNDYRDALVIKKGLLKNDNRELAEMHYKLALALEYKGDCEGALMEMESAMEILRWRLAALKDQSEAVAAGGAVVSPGPNPGKGKGKAMEKQMSAEEIEEERSDLEMLLPDIKLKIEELRSSLKPAAEGEVAEGATVTAVPAQVPVAAAVAAVNDLSMLVKKKAKPVEDANVMKRKMEEPAEAVADKKAKSDESN